MSNSPFPAIFLPWVGGLENVDKNLKLEPEGVAHRGLALVGHHLFDASFAQTAVGFVDVGP